MNSEKKNLYDSDEYNQVHINNFEVLKYILLHKILIIGTNNYSLYEQKLNIFYYVKGFFCKTMLP